LLGHLTASENFQQELKDLNMPLRLREVVAPGIKTMAKEQETVSIGINL
jgi:hypothetical protein